MARLRMYYYTNHVKYIYLVQKHFTECITTLTIKLLITARPRPTAYGDIEIKTHGNITESTPIRKMIKEMYIAKAFSIDDVHKMSVKS